ncbi:hypothetical protein JCM8208_001191 [Rhodotorula glutinis]
MFGPTLTSAVQKARESAEGTRDELSNELHAAERMRHEADELDAEQAEEIIEDEYRPLMGDENEGAEGAGGSESEGGRTGQSGGKAKLRRRWDEGGDDEVKVRKLEVWLAQGIFFVLGACILLSWNTTIVAGSYYGARLAGSPFEASFASFNALTFTTANLVFLAHANATQGKADLSRRISWSILVLAANLVLFIISTVVKEIPPALFFAFLIISSIILAASASYLQNAVVALSASFGPSYLNQILSGQGAIGFAVAMIQFVAAYGAVKSAPKEPAHGFILDNSTFSYAVAADLDDASLVSAAAAPPATIRQSAFTFFLTVGIFAFASFVCYIILVRLPLYHLVLRASFDSDAAPKKPDGSSSGDSSVSLHVVERKVRHLGVAMFLVFGVTLAVFPSITSTIVSVRSGDPDARILQRPELFVPLGFAVFAGGDWLGRVLPQWEKLAWTNWKILMACSVARVAFVPLFLMCNQTAGGEGRAIIRSDLAFFAIMLAFSLSNGYLSTLIMLASVVEPSLEQDEVEVAATCLAFYLTSGLAVGSFLSFGVRGAICHCNPFV